MFGFTVACSKSQAITLSLIMANVRALLASAASDDEDKFLVKLLRVHSNIIIM